MTDHVTIIIEWQGPYNLEEIKEDSDWGDGLYIATGILKNKQTEEIQYCGLTEGGFYGRLSSHHKIISITRNQQFWIGEVVYLKKPTRFHMEMAESIIIYFWQPTLNERKTAYPPKPVTLISYWLKPDGSPRLRQHKLCKDLDDVLSWDGKYWRTGNLSIEEE